MRSVFVIVIAISIFIYCSENLVNPFSSEEGFIVCTMYDDDTGRRQAFKLDLDGNIILKLTHQVEPVDYVRISPNGEITAFSRHFYWVSTERKKLGIVKNNGAEEKLFNAVSGRLIGWSPDGNLILTYLASFVEVINLEGEILFSRHLGYPQFNNNNYEIIYITPGYIETTNSYSVFKYNILTNSENFLGYFVPFRSFEHFWKKEYLIYESLNNELNIIHIANSEEFIIPYNSDTDAPKWSNDGRYIIYAGYPPPAIIPGIYGYDPGIIILSERGELLKVLRPGKNIISADMYIKRPGLW